MCSGAAGITGDAETLTIEITRDDEPRVVEVPEELAEALAHDAQASKSFEGLSYTHAEPFSGRDEEEVGIRLATRDDREPSFCASAGESAEDHVEILLAWGTTG